MLKNKSWKKSNIFRKQWEKMFSSSAFINKKLNLALLAIILKIFNWKTTARNFHKKKIEPMKILCKSLEHTDETMNLGKGFILGSEMHMVKLTVL